MYNTPILLDAAKLQVNSDICKYILHFVQNLALICRLLGGLIGFEGLINYGADEIVEAEITLRGVGELVYWCFRVGMCTACVWKLSFIPSAVVCK